jgi:parvulin-like peptidyl-prolyl isomerase
MRTSTLVRSARSFGVVLSLGVTLVAAGCTKADPSAKHGEGDAGKTAEGADGKDAKDPHAGLAGKPGEAPLGPIPEGPIAKVGDVEISRDAFLAIYDLKLLKYKDRDRAVPRSADRRYRRSITERLIWHEMLRQEAASLGVDYDPKALEERKAQQRKGIKDWEQHLRRRGESEASLEALFVAELRERAILEKLGKLTITDADVDAEYEKRRESTKADKERIRAAHILVQIGPEDRPAAGAPAPTEEERKQWEEKALARANEIYAKVSAPDADFTALARELSDGPSARKGGDLGTFAADRMVEDFSKVAFALKPGEVSKPVKTKFGYHVIKVFAKFPPGELPKEAMVDMIREGLASTAYNRGKRELKESLSTKYTVVNNMEKLLGPDDGPRMASPHGSREGGRPKVRTTKDGKPAEGEDGPAEADADAGAEPDGAEKAADAG